MLSKSHKLNRRKFLRNSALGILGAGIAGRKAVGEQVIRQDAELPKIKNYRRLGRTELMVSDIGSGEPTSSSVLKAVLESGVNFIETSESYENGRNERLIGSVMKDFSRDDVVIATKAYPALKLFKSSKDVIERAEDSLSRLQTDYIDIYMMHQAQNILRVKDNYFHRAADRLKKQGKIRFTGLSCHGPEWGPESRESLEEILMAAIEDGRFDVIFLPYNFLAQEPGERILQECSDNDIGTMIMKSNPILAYESYLNRKESGRQSSNSEKKYFEGFEKAMQKAESFLKRYNMAGFEEIKDGAVQFILSNPLAHTICCRFRSFSDVNKYVSLSGTTINDRNSMVLNDYKNSFGKLNCRVGCNICEEICPHHIPVSRILRYNYYFTMIGEEKIAMQKYKETGINYEDTCMDCQAYCEKACPHGVLTRPLMAMAHQNMSLNSSQVYFG